MKTIKDFNYNLGTLCITSALKNYCNNVMDYELEEEMYYGLGSGLFFAHTVSNDMSGIGGFAGDLLLNSFCDNMTANKIIIKSEKDSFSQIKYYIDMNMPILVNGTDFHDQDEISADIEIVEKLNLPMNYHFSLIVGYDKNNQIIRICDHRHIGNISYQHFLEIRDRRNEFYIILLPNKISNLDLKIYRSLNKICDYWLWMPENPKFIADEYTKSYLHLSRVNNTLDGLKSFNNSFLKGVELENFDNFEKTLFFLRAISYRGTGGDMTRGLFGRFLGKAAFITKDEEMGRLSAVYGQLSREWREFFKSFVYMSDIELFKKLKGKDGEEEIYKKIHSISAKEKKAIYMIKALVEKRWEKP